MLHGDESETCVKLTELSRMAYPFFLFRTGHECGSLTRYHISREAAVRGLDVEGLLAVVPEQLVTEHLNVLLDLAFQLRDITAREELGHGSTPHPVEVVIDCAEFRQVDPMGAL